MNHLLRCLLISVALACAAAGSAIAANAVNVADAGAVPATLAFANCSWDHPGVNPFMGDVVAAVDRYRDIPPDVRERLKARMARRDYDDMVSIRRDRIDGRGGYDYGNTISEMHFGTHQLCHSVTRTAWTDTMEERGLVYCDSGQCILIPTVCRNVSRIARSGVGDQAAAPLPLLAAATPTDGLPAIDWFGPTGAGPAGAAPGDGMGSGPADGDAVHIGPSVADGSAGPLMFGAPSLAQAAGPMVGAFTSSILGGQQRFPQLVPGTAGGIGGIAGVAAVPEPGVWATLLAGLVGIGLMVRQRRAGAVSMRSACSACSACSA